jgi:proteasome lid subunit RPN8/RPN11
MRWTDAPATSAGRTVAQWASAMRQRIDGDTLAAIVRRARHARPGGVPAVALQRAALEAAWGHVRGSALERGGLLLGEPLRGDQDDPQTALVHVRAAVAGLDGDATAVSLRLHAGVWDAARQALAPGEVVVGWFHSHPGIGAFFSDTDRGTQAGFFNHPFSLGWVIDPQRREQAWFVGARSAELPPEALVVLGPAAAESLAAPDASTALGDGPGN